MSATHTLPNGLRVAVDQLASTGVVAVSVAYRAGMRSDPPGASGLAHLAEHVSFGALARYTEVVDAAGGATSAATHSDHTEFATVVPAPAVPEVLGLEARRMRLGPISHEELTRQVRVLDEEVRTQIDGQDFAGHTVRDLPHLLLRDAPGDGYGSAPALAHVTPADVAAFTSRHYRPPTAVLTLAGDIAPDTALALVEDAFGDVDGGAPAPAPADEPWTVRDGQPLGTRAEGASAPAAVRGFLLPPVTELAAYLAAVLALRTAATLRGLVCRTGVFEPLAARTPDLAFLARYLTAGEDPRRVAEDADAALSDVAALRVPAAAVRAQALRWRRRLEGESAEPLPRARGLARGMVLHDDAELPDRVSRTLAALGEDEVAAAAAALIQAPRALLHVLGRAGGERP